MGESGRRGVLAWLDAGQTELVRAACAVPGLEITHAGGPRTGETREIAESLGAKPVDDLRSALGSTDAALVLLASSTTGTGMLESVQACAERGVRIATLEPLPASVLQLPRAGLGGGDEGEEMGVALGPEPTEAPAFGAEEWARFTPLARLSRPVRDAADILSQLGPIRMVSVRALCGSGEGSLGARLYDAMELILWSLGQPERVDAVFVAPSGGRGRGVHALPDDSLLGLDGDLSANLRFADGRAASIVASSRAGRWSREITMLGAGGKVRIDDEGLDWVGPDGRMIDSSRGRDAATPGESASPLVRLIGEQLSRLLDDTRPADAPTNLPGVLASAGAALLSARTGEGERPETLLRMARAG